VVDAGEDVRLLLRASWQPGSRAARRALVIVHGLGGSDLAGYVVSAGLHAWRAGWHVIRMNLRSAGDSVRWCARLYNAGLDEDLLAAVAAVSQQVPAVGVVGFSLGANLALLALARRASGLPPEFLGAVAIAAARSGRVRRRAGTARERVYRAYFMGNLGRRLRQHCGPPVRRGSRARPAACGARRAITAPYAGFRDAASTPRQRGIRFLTSHTRP
jgi:predicted alpha/beta-fold hydrolase